MFARNCNISIKDLFTIPVVAYLNSFQKIFPRTGKKRYRLKSEKVRIIISGHVRSVAPKRCASDRNCVFHSSLSNFFSKKFSFQKISSKVTLKMRAEKRARLQVTCVYLCGQTVVKLHNRNSVRTASPILEMTHAEGETRRNQRPHFLEPFFTKPPKYDEN